MSKKKDLGKLALGVSLGIGAGLLFAPKSGKETREELKEKIEELAKKAKEVKEKGISNELNKKIKELESEIASLDKEKVLKMAKEKANSIKANANDLVDLAKEKETML